MYRAGRWWARPRPGGAHHERRGFITSGEQHHSVDGIAPTETLPPPPPISYLINPVLERGGERRGRGTDRMLSSTSMEARLR